MSGAAPATASPLTARPDALWVFGEVLADVFPDQAVPGGAPFNVARHLGALGAPVWFISRVGDDPLGQTLRAEARRFGLDERTIGIDPQRASGQVTVRMADDGSHSFEIHTNTAWDAIDAAPFLAPGGAGLRASRPCLIHGSLALRSERSRAAWMRLADHVHSLPGGHVWLDLNWRAGHLTRAQALQALDAADTVKLNQDELAMVLAWDGLDDLVSHTPPAAGSLFSPLGVWMKLRRAQQLIVTYGGDGYAAFDRSGRVLVRGAATQLAQLVDTVGAGDAFSAITTLGLYHGWPLALTLQRANAFAAAVCGLRGAAPDNLRFYQPWRQDWGLSHSV